MADTIRAARIANERIRPAADRLGQTYFLYSALLKLAAAEDWPGLFSQFSDKDPLDDVLHGVNQIATQAVRWPLLLGWGWKITADPLTKTTVDITAVCVGPK